ncbi:hypothetical protein ECE18_11015, partial [Acinetobacter baumannii]|nr:hypothetical protein [Acinetobacter baumannii]
VALIDQIRTQSEEYKQPERYQDILKSQRLWKAYVDQECNNAGFFEKQCTFQLTVLLSESNYKKSPWLFWLL